MPFRLDDKLVVAISSSALFDLTESDEVYRKQGESAYRTYQRQRENDTLSPGVAFPFIRRLLSLNDGDQCLVEVVLLSKNDPDTGLRVAKSISSHGLEIIRMAFLQGGSPHRYIRAYNVSLFLSANPQDVKEAIMNGHPAGQVLDSRYTDDDSDKELRIAFDFDGVLIDDEAEKVYRQDGIDQFRSHEQDQAGKPHTPGPLQELMMKISEIQKRDNRVRVAIITSRDAKALERMVTTLRQWDINVNETHLLGGVEKKEVIAAFCPHIFFDDQRLHLDALEGVAPAVHVPFGIGGEAASVMGDEAGDS